MNTYQEEQLYTLDLVMTYLSRLSLSKRDALIDKTSKYLTFRKMTSQFLMEAFGDICTQKCFQNQLSACCSRDGIITHFADIVINALFADPIQINGLLKKLEAPISGFKCIYLSPRGCLFEIKPIVCELFLCDTAIKKAAQVNPAIEDEIRNLKEEANLFIWPDKPILFDALETLFMKEGLVSPLMYMHQSPGLLRVKKMAGLAT